MNKLYLDHLTKSYEGKLIINRLSCQFIPGCYAVTGPNGIGKSTLLGLLAGSILPDSGTILINGYNLAHQTTEAKSLLSYVPDQTLIYPFITGKEFLDFVAYSKNKMPSDATKALLEEFEIDTFLDIQIQEMSFGTQKKFFMVAALVASPALLLMDEPSNAIDKHAKSKLTNKLNHLKKNTIILFSTHDFGLIEETGAQKVLMPFSSPQSDQHHVSLD